MGGGGSFRCRQGVLCCRKDYLWSLIEVRTPSCNAVFGISLQNTPFQRKIFNLGLKTEAIFQRYFCPWHPFGFGLLIWRLKDLSQFQLALFNPTSQPLIFWSTYEELLLEDANMKSLGRFPLFLGGLRISIPDKGKSLSKRGWKMASLLEKWPSCRRMN